MRAVSLFSGCGGLDLGIRNAGFNVVLATDNNAHCATSHEANFPGTTFKLGPIQEVVWQLDKAVDGVIDLLVGGPPCPPYSKSRFYLSDKPRGIADPVGDETLKGYLDAVRLLEPRSFLLENVPGLAYGVHHEALDRILDTAAELGYTCNHGKLNAADFGVPQIRERYFVLGSREGAIPLPTPTHERVLDGALSLKGLKPWRTAGDVLHDLDTLENADDTGHFAGGKHHDLLRDIPPGDNYLFFTEKRGHPNPQFEWRKRYWSFLLKLSPDMPSWTIQAKRSNNMGPFHWRNRILRIEEIKRLQTFPDDWVLSGRVEDQWRQIGNAVPPMLAEALADSVRVHLSRAEAA